MPGDVKARRSEHLPRRGSGTDGHSGHLPRRGSGTDGHSGHLPRRGVGTDAADGHGLPAPAEVDPAVLTHLADDGHARVERDAGEEADGSCSLHAALSALAPREPQQTREAVRAVVLLQGPRAQRLPLQVGHLPGGRLAPPSSASHSAAAGPEGRADPGEGVVVPHPHLLQRQPAGVQLLHGLQLVQHLRQPLLLRVHGARGAGPDPGPYRCPGP